MTCIICIALMSVRLSVAAVAPACAESVCAALPPAPGPTLRPAVAPACAEGALPPALGAAVADPLQTADCHALAGADPGAQLPAHHSTQQVHTPPYVHTYAEFHVADDLLSMIIVTDMNDRLIVRGVNLPYPTLPTYYSRQPRGHPSLQPGRRPSRVPSSQPSRQPQRGRPSRQPAALPSQQPSDRPSTQPSKPPTAQPSRYRIFVHAAMLFLSGAPVYVYVYIRPVIAFMYVRMYVCMYV